MIRLQVLGPVGPQCSEFLDNARRAVHEAGVEATVALVTDMDVITEFGVIATPALVVNGDVKVVGRVLPPHEIRRFLP